uniref:hypothetical protein n=1 Tax=Kitasatospora indigofera TaxID=67307 RepID=UPI002F918E20
MNEPPPWRQAEGAFIPGRVSGRATARPSGPDPADRPDRPPITDRFESRPGPTAAELEEARRMLSSPQVLARVSPQLRDDIARPVPAGSAAVPQAGTRPAPAPGAPPAPYERGFGNCGILLALPQLGSAWELAGWKGNQLAYFVLHDGEIVGWVEIGIGAVSRWAAIADGHFLTDTDPGELLFHASPELAAAAGRRPASRAGPAGGREGGARRGQWCAARTVPPILPEARRSPIALGAAGRDPGWGPGSAASGAQASPRRFPKRRPDANGRHITEHGRRDRRADRP